MNILSRSGDANDDGARFVRFRTFRPHCPGGWSVKQKKEDRRVQRTRQLLLQALFSLIEERGFDAVTVQDIIDRANVGRSTFYTQLVDKEDPRGQAMDP